MLDEQVKSWSQRGHIDSLTEPVGGVDSKKNAHLVSSSTSAMPNVIGNACFSEKMGWFLWKKS
jgi:hypothetical protein